MKALRFILYSQVVVFLLLLTYVIILSLIVKYAYPYDPIRPWQYTPFNYGVEIGVVLVNLFYKFKVFLLAGLIGLIVSREKFMKELIGSFLILLVIYILARLNIVHHLFQFILHGYDCETVTFNNKFFPGI